jgi:hypothetical protein
MFFQELSYIEGISLRDPWRSESFVERQQQDVAMILYPTGRM